MTDFGNVRRRRSPLSHPGSVDFGGSDTASDISSWSKTPPFATPDNLQASSIQIQSALRSFGFSGRINFVNGSPEDVANVLNTIYNLLQRLQYEQCLKDDTQMENRRLRTEAQSYDNNLGRLRKELEIKERDLATSRIRERQEVDRHAEEWTVMTRDRDTLQKNCNNLTRRQIQFQHEIRRKELQYEWLQEKLRNYLAERKRESSASMEIVGRFRQQSPQRKGNKLATKIDDMMPGRNGGHRRSASRGPKLDETMVKMIVTAYEEKQKELLAENKDLQEALNSIRKEYTELMNAQMEKAESSCSKEFVRRDSRIYTTRHDSEGSSEEPGPQSLTQRSSLTGTPIKTPQTDASPSDASLPAQSSGLIRRSGSISLEEPERDYVEPPEEDIRRMAEIPDGVLNADHPDFVPWPIHHDVSLRKVPEGEGKQNMLDAAEHSPVLPTVTEEQETAESVKETSRDEDADLLETEEEEEPINSTEEAMNSTLLAEQSSLVLTSLQEQADKVETQTEAVRTNEHASALMDVQPPEAEAIESTKDKPASDEVHSVTDEQPNSVIELSSNADDNASIEDAPCSEDTPVTMTESSPVAQKKLESSSDRVTEGTVRTLKPTKASSREQSSPDGGSPAFSRAKLKNFVWPPPSASPPPREERSPRRLRPTLGKLPQPSNKPVPNAALLSEEQLKSELRNRAVDVEEAVRALKAACTSMQPENMRSVMEKRLHMELSMAANLAEQQEAVVNLALAGLERVRRTAPGSEAEMEELTSTVTSSLYKSESLVTKMLEIVDASDSASQLRPHLEEVMQEIQDLKEKLANRAFTRDSSPMNLSISQELDRSISSLRERAEDLTKEKELMKRARGDLDEETTKEAPQRRTWAEKAEEEKQLRGSKELSPDAYSDDEAAPSATLSRILRAAD